MVQVTYPGVYIEETSGSGKTITGVPTSITVFIGWAAKGPTDRAQRISSQGDYVEHFGGLDSRSYLGYAVSGFFANGGTEAYIIRIVRKNDPSAINNAVAAAVTLDGKLTLTARNEGEWGNHYRIGIRKQADDPTRFRLQVVSFVRTADADSLGSVTESFEHLSMDPTDSRSVVRIINDASHIVTAAVVGTQTSPPPDTAALEPMKGGQDGAVLVPDTADFESCLTDASGEVPHLNRVDLFNILCVTGETTPAVLGLLEGYCRRKRAFLIADCPETATTATLGAPGGLSGSLTGDDAINAACYFPWLTVPDPKQEDRPKNIPPSGFMAGIYSRADASGGVWKAPAGLDASLNGVIAPKEILTDMGNGVLNKKGINCIRTKPMYGIVAWGARTLRGDDKFGSEWKYIPVRRLALFIEESLYRGTQWVVFEPNDEPLWAAIRLNINAFMMNLFRQGAFQGSTPRHAFYVKCDRQTITKDDQDKGIVNIEVGIAPVKPAEFVVIRIRQVAGIH